MSPREVAELCLRIWGFCKRCQTVPKNPNGWHWCLPSPKENADAEE